MPTISPPADPLETERFAVTQTRAVQLNLGAFASDLEGSASEESRFEEAWILHPWFDSRGRDGTLDGTSLAATQQTLSQPPSQALIVTRGCMEVAFYS